MSFLTATRAMIVLETKMTESEEQALALLQELVKQILEFEKLWNESVATLNKGND